MRGPFECLFLFFRSVGWTSYGPRTMTGTVMISAPRNMFMQSMFYSYNFKMTRSTNYYANLKLSFYIFFIFYKWKTLCLHIRIRIYFNCAIRRKKSSFLYIVQASKNWSLSLLSECFEQILLNVNMFLLYFLCEFFWNKQKIKLFLVYVLFGYFSMIVVSLCMKLTIMILFMSVQ